MTKSILLRGAALFFAAVSPVIVWAQFQPPTDEELKMTADPKAPGAAAVYLDYVETANDPVHYRSVYARIKVLTEKGKELATVQIAYQKGDVKITAIKARTIHPDGTIVPLDVKPEDLMIFKTSENQVQKKVFTLPSVEVGSILEYRYDVDYNDNMFSSPNWQIQGPYFIHKAHYQFTAETIHTLQDQKGHIITKLAWSPHLPDARAPGPWGLAAAPAPKHGPAPIPYDVPGEPPPSCTRHLLPAEALMCLRSPPGARARVSPPLLHRTLLTAADNCCLASSLLHRLV